MENYEFMKHFIVLVAFSTIVGAGVATILEELTRFADWIVKKVRQHKEKKLTMASANKEE